MVEVIDLAEQRAKVRPKSETYEHGGQRYTCTFDPNAPKDKQWVWEVQYTRIYRYWGNGPSLEKAAVAARRKIHAVNKRIIEWEEGSG